jgi:YebC/PmpR family DNA-binding regulatory protein
MSGHSKWSTIKRQKGAVDAKRGALFTKLTRDIIVAAKQGIPDPEVNFRLRLAVQKARENNMPNDNIKRAIEKAAGGGDESQLEQIFYEGYGPGGTAVLVEALTDNRNRTVAEVRHAFDRGGGSMGESGSVAWQFEMKGVINVDSDGADPEELALEAMEAGADDFRIEGETLELLTDPSALEEVKNTLDAAGRKVSGAEVSMVAKVTVELDEHKATQTLKLLDRLEDLDDVQRVYSNAEFPDSVLMALEA